MKIFNHAASSKSIANNFIAGIVEEPVELAEPQREVAARADTVCQKGVSQN